MSVCSDAFYGTAFRYTSVATEGSASTADADYLDSFFQGRAIKQTINVNGKDISFYEETKGDTRHVILLPFRTLRDVSICSHFSFDLEDTSTIMEATIQQTILEFTCSVVGEVLKKAPKTKVHVLTGADVVAEELKKISSPGEAVMTHNQHGNYTCVSYDPKAPSVDFSVFDTWPSDKKTTKYAASREEQLKKSLSENGFTLPKVSVVMRGDQATNPHDCARFSMVYLMSALQGKDVARLTARDIYYGMHQFILSNKGLLSFQKKKITYQEVDKIIKQLENVDPEKAQSAREHYESILECRADSLSIKNKLEVQINAASSSLLDRSCILKTEMQGAVTRIENETVTLGSYEEIENARVARKMLPEVELMELKNLHEFKKVHHSVLMEFEQRKPLLTLLEFSFCNLMAPQLKEVRSYRRAFVDSIVWCGECVGSVYAYISSIGTKQKKIKRL